MTWKKSEVVVQAHLTLGYYFFLVFGCLRGVFEKGKTLCV